MCIRDSGKSVPGLESEMSNDLIPDSYLEGERAWCHVIYGLHALAVVIGVAGAASVAGAFVFGVPSLIAVVLNYVCLLYTSCCFRQAGLTEM